MYSVHNAVTADVFTVLVLNFVRYGYVSCVYVHLFNERDRKERSR